MSRIKLKVKTMNHKAIMPQTVSTTNIRIQLAFRLAYS